MGGKSPTGEIDFLKMLRQMLRPLRQTREFDLNGRQCVLYTSPSWGEEVDVCQGTKEHCSFILLVVALVVAFSQ